MTVVRSLDLPEATLGIKLAKILALSQFGQSEHRVDLSLHGLVEVGEVHANANGAIWFQHNHYA